MLAWEVYTDADFCKHTTFYMEKATMGKVESRAVMVNLFGPEYPNWGDHGHWSHHILANRRGRYGGSDRFYFLGLHDHCRW